MCSKPTEEADQARADIGGEFFFRLHPAVRGCPRMGDGRAHVAGVGSTGEKRHTVHDLPCGLVRRLQSR